MQCAFAIARSSALQARFWRTHAWARSPERRRASAHADGSGRIRVRRTGKTGQSGTLGRPHGGDGDRLEKDGQNWRHRHAAAECGARCRHKAFFVAGTSVALARHWHVRCGVHGHRHGRQLGATIGVIVSAQTRWNRMRHQPRRERDGQEHHKKAAHLLCQHQFDNNRWRTPPLDGLSAVKIKFLKEQTHFGRASGDLTTL